MIGVLALQGDFEKHASCFEAIGRSTSLVTTQTHLDEIDALVIPGGESSVLLKLSSPELRAKLQKVLIDGMPTFATCAGLIFLAKEVTDPHQESLGVLDVSVRRNAYGRQKESFVDPRIEWTEQGLALFQGLNMNSCEHTEGVFIRAPRITRIGDGVQCLAKRGAEPILVRQKNIFAMTFHPELTHSRIIHELFLRSSC